MREVFTSHLSEIKTVFNSNSDNEQFYNRLKTANCHILHNVELARPIIRRSNATIIWKCETKLRLKPITELSEDRQISLSFRLKDFFNSFKDKISSFRNVDSNFANQVIEIPNKKSILVNEENDYIVIVNWGFLEDSFDRKEGVVSRMFTEKRKSSILVKAVNKKSNNLIGVVLKMDSKREREIAKTDEEGYARFGMLEIGDSFSIFETLKNEEVLLKKFECDGRNEYKVELDRRVNVQLVFQDQFENPLSVKNFTLSSNEWGTKPLKSNELGEFSFLINVAPGDFNVYNSKGEKVFTGEIPDVDSTFKIEVPIEEKAPVITPPLTRGNKMTFQFINSFKKPIRNLGVNFQDASHNSFNGRTNKNGETSFFNISDQNLSYSFTRYRKVWNQSINVRNNDYHIIKVRSVFPWLWWILLFILMLLLVCCLFFNCFCNPKEEVNSLSTSDPIETLTEEEKNKLEKEGVILCNTENESGGEGVTINKHYLGQTPGKVEIDFNMQRVADKLEVFYEGKLVASTNSTPYSVDGFVGAEYQSGCCGVIQFQYVPNVDDFCIIKVTGPNGTVWSYNIDCPK